MFVILCQSNKFVPSKEDRKFPRLKNDVSFFMVGLDFAFLIRWISSSFESIHHIDGIWYQNINRNEKAIFRGVLYTQPNGIFPRRPKATTSLFNVHIKAFYSIVANILCKCRLW